MNKTYRHEDKLKATVAELSGSRSFYDLCHMRWNGEPLPSQPAIKEIIGLCREILFPGFFGNDDVNSYNLEYITGLRCERLYSLLCNQIAAGLALKECNCKGIDHNAIAKNADDIAMDFISRLPEIRRVLHTDVCAVYRGDPAAESREEVIYCYPAIKAISNYRIAHALLTLGVPVIPRMISEMAHSETGIDIHPGATIGEYFAIDHGTGVVIGATAIIGNNVKLYQGVTLGAKSFTYDENNNPVKGIPRHPIIGDNVVIYSNTSVLGRITIGNNAVIGGNIWVTEDVAENEKLVQAKANNILRFKQEDKA
ncbi:MAG TPA: serine acetyltransferase [Candidatus Limisoma gallistercoris]|nr:serine acetyltransferase [Candidatus Limisoma gallistercoris]